MKISTFLLSLLLSFIFALSASAAPSPKPSGTPPPPPSPPPPISKCKTEPLCCLAETPVKDVGALLGLFHAELTDKEAKLDAGLTCEIIKLSGGKKPECLFKPVCCEKSYGTLSEVFHPHKYISSNACSQGRALWQWAAKRRPCTKLVGAQILQTLGIELYNTDFHDLKMSSSRTSICFCFWSWILKDFCFDLTRTICCLMFSFSAFFLAFSDT